MVMCVLSYWLDWLDAAQMRQIWLLLLLLPILFGWFLIDTVRTTICQINNPWVHLRRHKYLIRNISTTRFELISFEAASLSILHFQTSKIRRVVVSRVSFYVHSREHETTYTTSFRAFSMLARFPQNEKTLLRAIFAEQTIDRYSLCRFSLVFRVPTGKFSIVTIRLPRIGSTQRFT